MDTNTKVGTEAAFGSEFIQAGVKSQYGCYCFDEQMILRWFQKDMEMGIYGLHY